MNELDIMKHAKSYIDQLANGIDPISGQEVPADSVLNQARLSRCFFYVSDVLGQVIENGGQVGRKPRAGKKAAFSLSMESRQQVEYSSEPLNLSSFLQRLDALVDRDVTKRIPRKATAAWLMEKGFLQEVPNPLGPGHTKVPTEAGFAIGLSLDHRKGPRGPYTVTLYNEEAQRFLVDNLDDILQQN